MGMTSTFSEAKEESSAEVDAQVFDEEKEQACSLLRNNRVIDQILKDDSRGSKSPSSSQSPLVAGLKKPAEVFRTDFIAGMKISESQSLPNGNYLDLKDTWRTEWEKGVQVPVNPDILPEIRFRFKDSSEHLNKRRQSFQLPETRISFDNPSDAVIRDQTGISSNYDLDEIDTEWIKSCVELKQRKNEIDEITMERAITYFERKCFENMVHAVTTKEGLSIEYDESTICDVCLSPDTEEGNEIVFCDACNMCAHQVCYGLLEIPHGNWLCRPCSRGILSPPCVLCPNRGGALKRVKDSYDWVHVICAWWIPEVKIEDTDNIENITVNKIPQSRWNLTCNLCREKMGACVQCSVKRCVRAYHITCAVKEGLEMKTIVIPEKDDVQHTSHCSKHCIPQPSGEKKTKGEIAENQRLDELKKLETEFYKLVTIKQAARDLHLSKEAIRKLYCFWTLKRKANDNVPLIPLTSEQKEQLSGKQGIIFIHEQMNMEAARFTILRQDLERLRNLCYMIVRREKVRRELHRSSYEVFYKQHDMLTKESMCADDEKWAADGDKYMRFVGFPNYTTNAEYEQMTGHSVNDADLMRQIEEGTELSRFRQLLDGDSYELTKTKSLLGMDNFVDSSSSSSLNRLDLPSFSDGNRLQSVLSCLSDLERARSSPSSLNATSERRKKRRRRTNRYSYDPPRKRKKVIKPKYDSSSETQLLSNKEASLGSCSLLALSTEPGTSSCNSDEGDTHSLSDRDDSLLGALPSINTTEKIGEKDLQSLDTSTRRNDIEKNIVEEEKPPLCLEVKCISNGSTEDDISNPVEQPSGSAIDSVIPSNTSRVCSPTSNSYVNESSKDQVILPNEKDGKDLQMANNIGKVLQDSENIPKDSFDDCHLNKWTNGQTNGERSDLDLATESENMNLTNSSTKDAHCRRRSSSHAKGIHAVRNSKSPVHPMSTSHLHNYRRLSPRLNKFSPSSVEKPETRQIIKKLKNEDNLIVGLEDFEKPQRITRSRQSLLKALEGAGSI